MVKVKSISNNIKELILCNRKITKIENIPNGIEELDLSKNQITNYFINEFTK